MNPPSEAKKPSERFFKFAAQPTAQPSGPFHPSPASSLPADFWQELRALGRFGFLACCDNTPRLRSLIESTPLAGEGVLEKYYSPIYSPLIVRKSNGLIAGRNQQSPKLLVGGQVVYQATGQR